jgi:hypothetical protein
MSKRKNKKYRITSEELFDFNKPLFNGFACGHGAYRDKSKYTRKLKYKQNWK